MSITMTDGTNTVTFKPHTIIHTNKYAVKAILYPTVVSVGLESKRVELMITTKDQTLLDFFSNLPDSVDVTASDYPEVPIGTYIVEACEVKRDYKSQNVRDVRLSMFRTA